MKRFIFPLLSISMSSFANEQLCGIDYASINFVHSKQVIKTDSNYLIRAMEKIEKVCDSKEIAVEKGLGFVDGYFDELNNSYNYDLDEEFAGGLDNKDNEYTYGYQIPDIDSNIEINKKDPYEGAFSTVLQETQEGLDMKALIQVCYDTVLNLKAIQGSCGVGIALEIESANYNVQQFCRIAENENKYLTGYLDGIN